MASTTSNTSDRDSLRQAIFSGAPQFRSERVEIKGVTVEVRQPSIRMRRELFNQCMDGNGNLDANEFLILSVLKSTFVPGTNDEHMFDEADYETIMNQPTGSWVDDLVEAMGRLTSPESQGKDDSDSANQASDDSYSS